MQKWLIVIIFFSSILPAVHSQNLIMNPSFELYETCPSSLATITFPSEGNPVLKNWNRATDGSPDYFNVCGSDAARIPNTSLGYQYPRTGNGYIGSFISDGENYREYFQSKLTQTLLPHHYYIGYWLNLANSDFGNIAALDQIGIYFSTDSLESGTTAPLAELVPQVVTPPYAILDDTSGWMNIHHSFLASGEERWMTVGSFLGEEDIHYDYFGSFDSYYSYYFFDDFCLLDLDIPMNVQDTLFVCQPGDSVNLADYVNTVAHFSFWNGGILSDEMWVYESGYYTARLVDQGHCKLKDISFLVIMEVSEYLLDLGTDTFICPGDHVILDATHPALEVYNWNNGMTAPVLENQCSRNV
ncbi:MAG: hypothetical protein KL787_00520 [Taibaiella sp.]|nr:hypothetical protein [Taibaiella sp.]